MQDKNNGQLDFFLQDENNGTKAVPMRLCLMQLAASPSEHADFLTCPRCGTQMPKVVIIAPMGRQPGLVAYAKMRVCHERVGKRGGPFDRRASEGSRLGLTILQDVNDLVLPPSPPHRGRRERARGRRAAAPGVKTLLTFPSRHLKNLQIYQLGIRTRRERH